MTSLDVFVLGDPAPQGSKSFKGMRGGKAVMVESSAKLAPWRDNVAWRVREAVLAAGWETLDAPCRVWLRFYLHRPVSAQKSRVLPDRKPDADKLARAVLDALTTAGAIVDDARVVTLNTQKLYANPPTQPLGVNIRVEAL